MEPHKELPDGIETFRPSITDGPQAYWDKAYAFARKYYADTMDQIASVKFENVDEDHFFREFIWTVHATGFSAKMVGKFMPRLVDAYSYYDRCAARTYEEVYERVRPVCNNPQKIKAVHKMAQMMETADRTGDYDSWKQFKSKKLSTPALLSELPYIGKITCYHLGRNIGLLDCVKPDLHLVRMAEYWKFDDCISMCRSIQSYHMDKTSVLLPLGIVDLVLWYSASTFGTIEIKTEGGR